MHVFKFLDIVGNKDDKRVGGTTGSLISSDATLRRNVSNPTHSLKLNGSSHGNSINLLLENQQRKKLSFDGSTTNGRSMEHIDKQWSEDTITTSSPKWSPMHSNKSNTISESSTPVNGSGTPNPDLSPDDEKAAGLAPLSNMQTYREYKEALKQQRNQDSTAVYRSKENTSSSGSSSSGGSNEASPMSPVNGNKSLTGNKEATADVINIKAKVMRDVTGGGGPGKAEKESIEVELDNNSKNNNNHQHHMEGGYVKPASPMVVISKNGNGTGKPGGADSTDSLVIKSIMNGNIKNTGKVGDNNGKTGAGSGAAVAGKNPKRTVSWNRDIVTPEKNISFTMRREFDRHKEEAELMGKLRNVSEREKKRANCNRFGDLDGK